MAKRYQHIVPQFIKTEAESHNHQERPRTLAQYEPIQMTLSNGYVTTARPTAIVRFDAESLDDLIADLMEVVVTEYKEETWEWPTEGGYLSNVGCKNVAIEARIVNAKFDREQVAAGLLEALNSPGDYGIIRCPSDSVELREDGILVVLGTHQGVRV